MPSHERLGQSRTQGSEQRCPRKPRIHSVRVCSQLLLLTLALCFILISDASYAQSFGRINTALQTLVDFMTGTTGRLLGILGVAGLGIAAWFGRLSYWRAGEIILGIAIVFGSAEIVDLFAR